MDDTAIQPNRAKSQRRKEECVSIRLSLQTLDKIFTTEITEEGREGGGEGWKS